MNHCLAPDCDCLEECENFPRAYRTTYDPTAPPGRLLAVVGILALLVIALGFLLALLLDTITG